MTCRCKSCNQHHNFKASRGNKLSEHSCWCGGKYELISYHPSIDTTGLILPEGIPATDYFGAPLLHVWKNRKGVLFTLPTGTRVFIQLSAELLEQIKERDAGRKVQK